MKRLAGILILGLVWCAAGDYEPVVEATTPSLTLDVRTQVLTVSVDEQAIETWTSASIRTSPDRKIDTSTPLGTILLIR